MEANRPAEVGAVTDGSSLVSPGSSPIDESTFSRPGRSTTVVSGATTVTSVRSGTAAPDVDRRPKIAPDEIANQAKIESRIAEIVWRPPQHTVPHRFLKRTLDIVVSATALIVLSPLFLLIALAVYLTDFGPVFFSQDRVGTNGRFFRFFKFRTMEPNAEAKKTELVHQNNFANDITFKMPDDPRVTMIGRFLRKSSLDEFPQLLHVLTGDMALVGPRPAVPNEVQYYSEIELRRVFVKPGLTCYWQVSGRSDLPFEEQVRLDLEYIRNETVWVDLWILIRTLPALALMKGAY